MGRSSSIQREKVAPHPTILIATTDPDERRLLAQSFEKDNSLVLEASSSEEMLRFVRFHSRPIQVLLLQQDLIQDGLSDFLQVVRRYMHVLVLQNDGGQSGLTCDVALAKARQLLNPIDKWSRCRREA